MFYEHELFGLPVMRPLLSKYPKDAATFAIDNEFLLSDVLLVRPVDQPSVSSVDVYFPNDLWYDIDDYAKIDSIGYVSITVDSKKVKHFFTNASDLIFTRYVH